MRNRPPWIVEAGMALLLITSCGVSNQEPPAPAMLVSLFVTPVNSGIAPGTTRQFTATGTFSDNSKRNLTTAVSWDSSDTGIAGISNAPGSKGLASATLIIGFTTITATSGVITGSATLTTSPVASIAVSPPTSLSIAPGTTEQFTATGTLADGTIQNLTTWATWTSANQGVATFSDVSGPKGLATAVNPGSTAVTASYGGVTGSATLTSSALALIAITPALASVAKGTTQQFTAIGTLADGNTQGLTTWATWNSSSTTIATISNTSGSKGLATAAAEGAVSITATFSGVTSNSAALFVTPALLVSIAVTPTNQTAALGLTQQFIATGKFTDNTTQDITSSVTWNSSGTAVATISNTSGIKGLAASHSPGTANITANLSGITSNAATLTITPAVLAAITIAPAIAVIVPTGTQQFTATGTNTDESLQDLTTSGTWNSSAPSVATISNAPGSKGLAKPVNNIPGSTTITATLSGITSNAATLTVRF